MNSVYAALGQKLRAHPTYVGGREGGQGECVLGVSRFGLCCFNETPRQLTSLHRLAALHLHHAGRGGLSING